MKQTGATQATSKKLHAGRKAATVHMAANGVFERHIKRMLNHATPDTTQLHYDNAPPLQASLLMAGWIGDGSDFDPLHALARTELDRDFADLSNAVIPHSAAAQRYIDDPATRQDMTTTCHVNLLREASKCTIESAAMLYIN
jgi:hypothetical protein